VDKPLQPKWMTWTGRVLSILPVALFLISGAMKFTDGPEMQEGLKKMGWTAEVMHKIAIIEIVCAVLYLVPQTAVLGAILLTGYLGGAIATHVRVNDAFIPPIVIGIVLWLGIFLRDPRLRTLLPFRTPWAPATGTIDAK
jgi:uncharacterized membrane protein YphA (DoxX/SURF4 family)